MMNIRIVLFVVVALIGGVAIGWYVSTSQTPQPSSVASASKQLTLPANAEMFIPCIKGHGAHYSEPENIATGQTNRPWVGPSYVVREDTGAVMGIEYHVSSAAINQESVKIADLVNKIVAGDASVKLLYDHKFPVLGANYDSIDILYIAGHPGFEVPHYDIHAWTLPKVEHTNIGCPSATL